MLFRKRKEATLYFELVVDVGRARGRSRLRLDRRALSTAPRRTTLPPFVMIFTFFAVNESEESPTMLFRMSAVIRMSALLFP